jgi:hypothetical protein
VGVAACVAVLPLAAASAGQVGREGSAAVSRPDSGRSDSGRSDSGRSDSGRSDSSRPSARDDHKAPFPSAAEHTGSPRLLGLGLATAARCGPELTSPHGVEAQTCVLTQGEESWARTYYRNATGDALEAVLSLLGPGGRTVRLHCEVAGEDEPGTCETPRERTRGDLAGYTAVAEFATRGEDGPLLLRSGSNSGAFTGS